MRVRQSAAAMRRRLVFDTRLPVTDRTYMRRLALIAAMLLFATPAAAQPPDPYIIAMAQHFVQDRLMTSETEHYHIEFDNAFLYSRPRQSLWVVVGGYVSDQNTPNSFTAAVLLECAAFEKVACWSLEKLSINGRIVLDRKRI